MPFYSKEDMEKRIKASEMNARLEKKKETQLINDQAKADQPNKTSIANDVHRATALSKANLKNSPSVLGPSDLKKFLQSREIVEADHKKSVSLTMSDSDLCDIRSGVIKIASWPQRDAQKRERLQEALESSTIIKNYLDDRLYAFSMVNDHLKAGCIYGLKYLQTSKN